MLVSLNSKVLRSALIPASSQAALYGRGVFTTVRILNGAPFLWDKHWRRLIDNAGRIGLDVGGFTEQEVIIALAELIEYSNVVEGRARITFLDRSSPKMWSDSNDAAGTDMVITIAKPRSRPDEFAVTTSPHLTNSRSPLSGIKSCNYLEKLIAKHEATDRGFDECILLNERGEVCSASMANVFWLRNGKLFTPSLRTGCLPGTTREFVLENLECVEVEADLAEISSADEIFLTSAGLGVTQVAKFDDRRLPCPDHPIMHLLPKV